MLLRSIMAGEATGNATQKTRLYSKGKIMGFRRGIRTHDRNTSLIKIEGVQDKAGAEVRAESLRAELFAICGHAPNPHGAACHASFWKM